VREKAKIDGIPVVLMGDLLGSPAQCEGVVIAIISEA
jgi:hypothetical protein